MWTTILWFLIIGVVFYFLMRMGGCGAHGHGGRGGHGGHGGHDHGASDEHDETWAVKDPVCGAAGPADKAPATADYHGKPFYFCSRKCRDLFMENPEHYTGHDQATPERNDHHEK